MGTKTLRLSKIVLSAQIQQEIPSKVSIVLPKVSRHHLAGPCFVAEENLYVLPVEYSTVYG